MLLACLAGNILPVLLIDNASGHMTDWLVHSVIFASRGIALLYLTLIFMQIGKYFKQAPLVITTPYLGILLSVLAVSLFMGQEALHTHVVLLFMFFAATFSYLSSRIRHAFILIRHTQDAPEPDTMTDETFSISPAVQPVAYDSHEALQKFADKYHLSLREQEVLHIIIDGADTVGICQQLHISENTVKTHVRHILRKTNTANRITLASLFYKEAYSDAP